MSTAIREPQAYTHPHDDERWRVRLESIRLCYRHVKAGQEYPRITVVHARRWTPAQRAGGVLGAWLALPAGRSARGGPLIRALEAATDRLFGRAGIVLE